MTKNLSFTPYSLFLFFSGGLYNEVALTSLWLNAHPIIIFQAHVFVLKVAMGSLVQEQTSSGILFIAYLFIQKVLKFYGYFVITK